MTNTPFLFRRGRVLLSIAQLKAVLDENVRNLYPEKNLSDVEVSDILQSVINSVIVPLIEECDRAHTLQQATCDLIVFHLPNTRDTMDRAYDIYTSVEMSLINLILTTIPQLTVTHNLHVVGFCINKRDTLVLDVCFDNAYTDRTQTTAAEHDESFKWDLLELARF